MKSFINLILFVACCTVASSAGGGESALKKYEAPTQITQIDWILLKAELRSVNLVQYDKIGLIATVGLSYSSGRVRVDVTVASGPFRSAPRADLERIFTEVIVHVESVLKREIPEIDRRQNMRGLFTELNGAATKQVAGWEDGSLIFYK